MTKNKKLNRSLAAFSLTEVSIALIIMGILIGGALKGKQLIRSARLNSVALQLKNYEMDFTQYRDGFGRFPGTNSDGSVKGQKEVWEDLFRQTHREMPKKESPDTKIGGTITFEKDPLGLKGYWLVLSKSSGHEGLVTPHEAQALLSKHQEHSPTEGTVRVLNGSAASTCLSGQELNLTETNPVCIVAMEVG